CALPIYRVLDQRHGLREPGADDGAGGAVATLHARLGLRDAGDEGDPLAADGEQARGGDLPARDVVDLGGADVVGVPVDQHHAEPRGPQPGDVVGGEVHGDDQDASGALLLEQL